MSTIRCVYLNGEPNFPATDQHPDAVRYTVGFYIVDAVGGEPTLAEVEALLRPVPAVSVKRDRKRDMRKLEEAIADADQPVINSLLLKLLKDGT